MLRKLSTFSKWGKLSLLRLREELARRGLKRIGTKEEMIQRLQENEDTEIHEKAHLDIEDVGNSALNSLSKSFLMLEILKRNPDFVPPSKHTRQHLIESLNSIIIDSKSKGANDLKSLLLKASTNLGEISIKEIFAVLDGLKDPYQISQLDLNVLLNSDPLVLAPIWNLSLERVDYLDYKQVHTLLASIHTLQDNFKKRFTADGGKILASSVEKALIRIKKISSELTSLDIAKILHISNLLLREEVVPTSLLLKQDMLSQLNSLNELTETDLFVILENLPLNSYQEHSQTIQNIISRIKSTLPETSSEKVIAAVFGMQNAGCSLPFRFTYYIDSIPKDFLKKLSPPTLYQLCRILSEKNMLSEETGKNIIDV